MSSWIIHFGSYFPLVILIHVFSFFFFFPPLLNFTLNCFLLGRSYISEGSEACPKSGVFFPPFQWQAGENKSWKACFPSLLHIPPRTLSEQGKAKTTGDNLSAGKKICLTALTQSGNLLWVVVLSGSSRHENLVILGSLHLSGVLFLDSYSSLHYTQT